MLTKMMGTHTIKVGGECRHTRDFLLQTQDNGGPRGQFQFSAHRDGDPERCVATRRLRERASRRSCSTGRAPCSAISRSSTPGMRSGAFFTFIQDKWAVRAEADDRSRPAPRVLHAVHGLDDQGDAVELRSGDEHAAGRRLRQRRRERRRARGT